ncbi:MAG TPA: ABC transporter permease [Micromonosporaceae bacterium]
MNAPIVAATPAISPAGAATIAAHRVEGLGPLRLAARRLGRDPVAIAAAVVILMLALVALGAPVIAHVVGHGPDTQFRDTGLTPAGLPVGTGSRFLLGTDNLGRDLLVRIVYGARISLLVGVVSTLLAVCAGVLVGMTAGYHGGAVDTFLARFMDVVLSFPFLLFAVALVSVVGPSLTVSILVIAFFSWPPSVASSAGRRSRSGSGSTWRPRGRWARATCASCSWTCCRTWPRRSSSTPRC